jgi:8-oxo-dGTP diphosphatase
MSLRVRPQVQAVSRQTQLAGIFELQAIHVAAGILRDASGRVLITERLDDSPFAGLWEFPGGKISPGETAMSALARELYEELGIAIEECEHFMSVDHNYSDRSVVIDFYLVTRWQSTPVGLEGQALRWIEPEMLKCDELVPADIPVLMALRASADAIRKCLSET